MTRTRPRATRALASAAIALLLIPLALEPAQALDHTLYAALLERHTKVVPDTAGVRVDYQGLAKDPDWPKLVAGLRAQAPAANAPRAERFAFWINAYNILAIQTVLDAYPVESIRDVGSFFRPVWKRDAGQIAGRTVTLDEIEHDILRPMGDPRIHAAIVCASVSCPSLMREPWDAAKLDAQYDATLRGWLASPAKGMRIDRAADTIHLSKIFDWFEDDFDAAGGVLAFVARYVDEDDRAWLARNGGDASIRYLDYDWSLNDLAKAP